MEPRIRERLIEELKARRDNLVEDWFGTLVGTGYVPLSARALHERLGDLLDRFISLWLSESPLTEEARHHAQDIGASLASLHLVSAEALGETMRILNALVPESLPAAPSDMRLLHLRLAFLVQGVVAGFYRQGRDIILAEQEQVRSALVGELRAAQVHLRAARDELEVRVAQRTAELAQANADLKHSQERWRLLVENAPDMVGTLDRDGIIHFLNRLPPGSPVPVEWAIGADGTTWVVEEHRELVRRTIRDAFDKGVSATHEIAYTTLRGTTVWYAVSFGPIRQNGEVVEVLFISRNIDQRKKLEQLKDNLIHDVSHELRTPAAKIRMSLELLQEIAAKDDPDLERIGRISHLAATNVDSLIDTLEGILDLSRLEAGKWTWTSEPLRLEDLIARVVTNMGPFAQGKGLLLTSDVQPGLPSVPGDGEKLERVFVNLVDNACKFSDRGTIALAARAESRTVHFSVADEGEGILPENLERVFERFFQEKTSSHGVGIGLAMCKAIVEAHNGEMWAESQGRGTGATFHVVLPAVPDQEET